MINVIFWSMALFFLTFWFRTIATHTAHPARKKRAIVGYVASLLCLGGSMTWWALLVLPEALGKVRDYVGMMGFIGVLFGFMVLFVWQRFSGDGEAEAESYDIRDSEVYHNPRKTNSHPTAEVVNGWFGLEGSADVPTSPPRRKNKLSPRPKKREERRRRREGYRVQREEMEKVVVGAFGDNRHG